MRKTLVLGLSIFMMVSLYGTASAWTLRVRHDPRETQLRWDIRKVSSDLTARKMFLQVTTWGRWKNRTLLNYDLDTNGTREFDRIVQVGVRRHHLVCAVFSHEGSHLIGFLRPNRPNPRTIGCVIPRSWFPRIHRAVRFRVGVYGPPDYRLDDRAPNHGLYLWV